MTIEEYINTFTKTKQRDIDDSVIYASSFGYAPYLTYMLYKNGFIKTDRVEDSTFGTIFQLGIDKLFENRCDITSALKIRMEYKNYTISGEIDQVFQDNDKIIIIDNKLTKNSKVKDILNNKLHPYRIQLSLYRYMYSKVMKIDMDNIYIYINMFFKDGNKYAKDKKEYHKIVKLLPLDNIETHLDSFIKELDEIRINPEQARCWEYKYYKRSNEHRKVDMTDFYCLNICSYIKHCNIYKQRQQHKRDILINKYKGV